MEDTFDSKQGQTFKLETTSELDKDVQGHIQSHFKYL